MGSVNRCGVCGMPLPPRPPGKRGAPQRFCLVSTGRQCVQWNKRLQAIRSMGDKILDATPSANRDKARSRMRTALREARAELAYSDATIAADLAGSAMD